ncbi:MAG: hypothetical protein HQ517_01975 [SAR324 cluster bacterium]|nr:hypothetical protein [SAR324 cluster bacterium]
MGFDRFIRENINSSDAEFFITHPVDDAIKNKLARVKLLETGEKWLGITYSEDKATVASGLRALIDKGLYPSKLALK